MGLTPLPSSYQSSSHQDQVLTQPVQKVGLAYTCPTIISVLIPPGPSPHSASTTGGTSLHMSHYHIRPHPNRTSLNQVTPCPTLISVLIPIGPSPHSANSTDVTSLHLSYHHISPYPTSPHLTIQQVGLVYTLHSYQPHPTRTKSSLSQYNRWD